VPPVTLSFTVDDPLDAVAVHFGGGLWGLISASVFSNGGIVFGASQESGSVREHITTL
jgi:Amt family ammonium transporter